MSKPILCLDFDGVIHSYASGWKGADIIPDPPVPGAIDFIIRASAFFRVSIFSSRSGQEGGMYAMKSWLWKHAVEHAALEDVGVADAAAAVKAVLSEVEWPDEKPPAFLTIDDRAITFTGAWPNLDDLLAFKPWNKP